MEFMTEAQRECYERIHPMMKEVFGDFAMERDDVPAFGILIGTSLTQIAVFPWGDDDATITARAYVVRGPEMTPDLMHYLLRKNDNMRFGAFGVDDDGDIFFEHTIVGSTCDREELRASVMAVATTSDRLDEEIVSRWGGQRATD